MGPTVGTGSGSRGRQEPTPRGDNPAPLMGNNKFQKGLVLWKITMMTEGREEEMRMEGGGVGSQATFRSLIQ